jgi:hypothetical protein
VSRDLRRAVVFLVAFNLLVWWTVIGVTTHLAR